MELRFILRVCDHTCFWKWTGLRFGMKEGEMYGFRGEVEVAGY